MLFLREAQERAPKTKFKHIHSKREGVLKLKKKEKA